MKKYINILFAATVAAFSVLSCSTKEQDPYTPGEPEENGCFGVYFPAQDASGSHIYSPVEDPVIEIKVARKVTNGNITVPVVTEFSEDGIFTVDPVTFADGQAETTFNVSFPNAKEGTNYSASIYVVDNQYAAKYSDQPMGIDFSIMRVEMKDFLKEDGSGKAKVTFTDMNFTEEVHEVYIQYYEVDGVRYCETLGGNTIYSGNELDGEGPWGTDVQLKFKWHTNKQVTVDDVDYDWIEVEPSPIGFTSSGNPIYMGDYFHMRADMGLSNGDYTDSYDRYTNGSDGYKPSYYDGHGGFIFNAAYWIHTTTSWYGYQDNTPVAIAEGYLRVDYSLELEPDYADEGVLPVYVTAGVDVDKIKYAIYEGELNSAQLSNKIEGIIGGTEETETFSDFALDEEEGVKYATLEIELEKTGNYTIVAVAYDAKGNAQTDASATFRYISAEDSEEYLVDMHLFVESTPERYRGLHKYDSFAYCMYGSDLTEVHVGIFDFSKLKDPNAAFDAVKSDSKYAVSDEVLAEINAQGGLYDVLTGLNAKTTYLVIMWATNGNLDGFAYDMYTTDKLPYVWNMLGIGLYTEDVAGGIYGIGPLDVECHVYEEKTTPGLYMIDGYQKNYIALLLDPEEDGPVEDYEGILWRNSELVIDATNPANVTIELQDYGICLNTSDGFIDGLTSMYNGKPFSTGTLENGVISFPTPKGMLALLDGDGYYYANQDGAFKLVLPSASGSSNASAPKPTGFNVNAANKALFAPKQHIRYERDPQPRPAKVTVSYTRKEKVSLLSRPVEVVK
jgi:hypothetical protein